jgi:hypothetical protein
MGRSAYTPRRSLPLAERPSLTTSEVAMVAGVSPQTVIRCCDTGDLEHFRIPLSKFRRVTPRQVRAWAERHGITLKWDVVTPHEGQA